jgi:hypothetical protein
MVNFSAEMTSKPCCPVCSSQIQQLTDDLEPLGESFESNYLQAWKDYARYLQSILDEHDIFYSGGPIGSQR